MPDSTQDDTQPQPLLRESERDTQPQPLQRESAHDTQPQALAADDDPKSASIARQPIVDSQGRVFGYELFDRTHPMRKHTAASDAQLLFNVLSHADHGALIDSHTLFINCAQGPRTSGRRRHVPK